MYMEGPTFFPLWGYIVENWQNEPWVFAMLVYHVLNFIWEASVWIGQIRCIVSNLTSNEMINMMRYQHFKDSRGRQYNPFDKGVKRNVYEFFYDREKWYHEYEIKGV
jgi:hypothetical protein